MADGLFRRNDEYYWRIDRKFDELEQLLRSFATQRGKSIQSCDRVHEEKESRTLFVKIHSVEYFISWEILDQVFSSFGTLEIIEVFHDEAQFHSRIRFQSLDSALKAFDSLNGRCIYDDCCRLELFLGSQSNDISSDRPCAVETQYPIEDASQFEGHQAPINSKKMFHADIEEIEMLHASLKDQNQSEKRQVAQISDLGVSSIARAEEIGKPGGYSVNSNHEWSDSQEAENPKLEQLNTFEAKIERQDRDLFGTHSKESIRNASTIQWEMIQLEQLARPEKIFTPDSWSTSARNSSQAQPNNEVFGIDLKDGVGEHANVNLNYDEHDWEIHGHQSLTTGIVSIETKVASKVFDKMSTREIEAYLNLIQIKTCDLGNVNKAVDDFSKMGIKLTSEELGNADQSSSWQNELIRGKNRFLNSSKGLSSEVNECCAIEVLPFKGGKKMIFAFDPGIAEWPDSDVWMGRNNGKFDPRVKLGGFHMLDREKKALLLCGENVQTDYCSSGSVGRRILIFDPGGVLNDGKLYAESTSAVFLITTPRKFVGLIFVYDPGGINCPGCLLSCWQHWELLKLVFGKTLMVFGNCLSWCFVGNCLS